ncbi:MAG: HAMP domain-containing histidine kinase [Betaproteobacteria bacterium]|nr:HAMP domain-containing histidine kinase [Betaproteobacteria bacterium]
MSLNNDSAAHDIKTDIRAHETLLLYRSVAMAQTVNLVNAILTAYLDVVLGLPARAVWGWCALVSVTSVGRYLIGQRFFARSPGPAEASRWRRYYLVGAVLSGAVWGIGSMILLWHAPEMPVLVTALVLAGMVAGAVPILAPMPLAFTLYAALLCLPITLLIFLQDHSPIHMVFGIMCLIYFGAMLTSARYLHSYFHAVIRLGLEKGHLAVTLEESLGQLRQAQRQLVESEKLAALGGLMAGIAHEVNTPLGVAVTAASVLEDETRAQAERYRQGDMKKTDLEQYLSVSEQSSRMILQNLSRAAGMIRSFKQVAVDRSNESQRRVFNVYDYLQDIMTSLTPALRKAGATFTVACEPELAIDSYPGLLSQIVTNLVMNALVHGFEGRPGGTIRIAAQVVEGEFRLEVEDDGQGMNEAVLDRIFEPFFTTRRGAGGSGLGLHVVYDIVTGTLKGRIECRSRPGKGATFSVCWPL